MKKLKISEKEIYFKKLDYNEVEENPQKNRRFFWEPSKTPFSGPRKRNFLWLENTKLFLKFIEFSEPLEIEDFQCLQIKNLQP